MIAGSVVGIALLSGIFFVFYRNVRQKHKVLQQEKEIDKLRAAMNGEEQERIRIARELHDGIMVQFSSVKMNLGSILRRMEGHERTDELHEVISQLDNATQELRRSAHNLMPDMLLAEGLSGAVRYFCSSLRQSSGITIEFQQYGEVREIKPEYELMLYRIIQELVQNAIKYAAAGQIIVQLDATENLFTITVEDNGAGLTPKGSNLKKAPGSTVSAPALHL